MTHTSTDDLLGIRVNVDGSLQSIRIGSDAGGTHVEGLNRAVGSALFDVIGLPGSLDVFVDDEGLYTAEYNPTLSRMVQGLQGSEAAYRLHGAGVFLGVDDARGDTLSLSRAQRAQVAASWFAVAPISAV